MNVRLLRRATRVSLVIGGLACATAIHAQSPSGPDALSRSIREEAQQVMPPAPATVAEEDPKRDLDLALLRLPLAAVLGAALALRPRRRGTPPRTPAVVETQIILSVIGSVVMLVVGASLARAFGIVGAANLIRYRSKIDDPKDACVMLGALAVGLATGVGLFGLAVFSTIFLVALLALIESFEPKSMKRFVLKIVKPGKETAELRTQVETVLRRHRCEYELRAMSPDELSFDVKVPLELDTDRLTTAIMKLTSGDEAAVDWDEKKTK